MSGQKGASRVSEVGNRRWDAGEIGCGSLMMQLRPRIAELEVGQAIEITARDPGAGTDLPAWCRMTGHELVSAEHPVYVIRRTG